MMRSLGHDLRYGVRSLSRQPGFTLLAAVTLALGIGATTTIFSVVNGVLIRPLPYRGEERLATLWQTSPESGGQHEETSPGVFLDWRDRLQSFEALAAVEPFGHTLVGDGEPERFRSWLVSEGFFEILGTPPLLGRTFLPEEHQAGSTPAVVLGYGLWQRRFGGDPGIVGRPLALNGRPHTVVGVMPPEFLYPPGREIWAPRVTGEGDQQIRAASYIKVVGRLRPDADMAAAQAEASAVTAQLAAEHPGMDVRAGAVVVPLRETLVGHARRGLLVLLGAVGFVLLIACANVANLMLARGARRGRELAIRAALGAGRPRLVRLLVMEASLLAAAGGAGGLLLAYWLLDVIVGLVPGDLPRLDQVGVDTTAGAFAAGIALVTTLLFGLLPAFRLTRLHLESTLRDDHRASPGGRKRLRHALVVAEMGLALMLLAGAGLLIRSFVALTRVDPGFQAAGGLAVEIQQGRQRTPAQMIAFVDGTLERLQSIPGVRAAGATTALPFHDNRVAFPTPFRIADRPVPPGSEAVAFQLSVTPGYPEALGVPLLAGRALTAFDDAEAAPVVLVNRTLARRHWPQEDPIGRRIAFESLGQTMDCEIVGVIGDTRPSGLDSEPEPEIYVPYAQAPFGALTWLVRAGGDPWPLLPAVKQAMRATNPGQTFASIATLEQLFDRSTGARRFQLGLLAVFAALALLLAAVGLYGVMSVSTAQRTREFGIRIALGARGGDLLRLVLVEGMGLTFLGLLIGLTASLGLTRLMAGLLYGIEATDVPTFAGVSALLAVTALLACFLPARRATRVEPTVALRSE